MEQKQLAMMQESLASGDELGGDTGIKSRAADVPFNSSQQSLSSRAAKEQDYRSRNVKMRTIVIITTT